MSSYTVRLYNSHFRHDDVGIEASSASDAAEQFLAVVNVPMIPFHGICEVIGRGINTYRITFEVTVQ